MIDINLIPASLRKNGQENNGLAINLSKEVVIGVVVGVVFILGSAHLVLGAIWFLGNEHLMIAKSQWSQVLPDKVTMDSINKESGDLNKKIKMIAEMTTKKTVLWAPKFNIISDDLPKGVWLRRMVFNKIGLSIEGSVVSKNQNEINNVGLFLSELKQNDDFMKDFSTLEENSIQGGKNYSVEVTDFTVMAKLK